MKGWSWKQWTLSATVIVVLTVGGGVWYVGEGLRRASKFADFGLCAEARGELDLYLRLYRHDARAHVLYAEMLVKDSRLNFDKATEGALAHLAQVPDSAPLGATARMQEGRIEFLLLNRPARAERQLRRALEIDPQLVDAARVLWKLYDQTGRSHLAEPFFRAVYDHDPWPERVLALRDWYMSQFFPTTANLALDRLMGFVPQGDQPNPDQSEVQRFIRFRNSEPDAPLSYAAIARWFQLEGDPEFALKVLDDGLEKMEGEERDPFFIHTAVGILLELGEVDRADELFSQWPEPHEGYEYWVSRSLVREARRDDPGTLESLRKVSETWPGMVDYRAQNRLVSCLARMGRTEEEQTQRTRLKALDKMMLDETHRNVRQALGRLDDRHEVRRIEDFYRKLHRDYEADGWRDHHDQLAAGKKMNPQIGEAGGRRP